MGVSLFKLADINNLCLDYCMDKQRNDEGEDDSDEEDAIVVRNISKVSPAYHM